ncbi:MAG: hypothetical protein AAGG08_19910, partial [Actinomycetota bacterium]
AEAIGEARHLVDGLADGSFPFGALVTNLLHPLPPELPDDGTLDEPWSDALREQIEWHRELTELAAAERAEIAELTASTESSWGDATLVEMPLRDQDIHDLDGLADFADDLVRESVD